MGPRRSADRTGLFSRLPRKGSEPKRHNKKPLQKHIRKSHKAETTRGLRHPPKTLAGEQKQVTRQPPALMVSRLSVVVAKLRTGLSQFREKVGAEAVGAQKPHLASENRATWAVGQSPNTPGLWEDGCVGMAGPEWLDESVGKRGPTRPRARRARPPRA